MDHEVMHYHKRAVRFTVRYLKQWADFNGHRYGEHRNVTMWDGRTKETRIVVRNRSMRPLIHKGRKNR